MVNSLFKHSGPSKSSSSSKSRISAKPTRSSQRLSSRSIKDAEKVFEVNIKSQSFNGMETLGMIGCVNNNGGLCHPDIDEGERKIMEDVLAVPMMEGTVNFGMPLVGAGVITSSKGAVCGRQSTGVELGRVEEALKLF